MLPAAERATVPWRNGGGTTQTVAAWPLDSGPDAFGWRLSIAEVAAEGPFSRFPGVERHLANLDGRLSPTIADIDQLSRSGGDPALTFSGNTRVTSQLDRNTVGDLNQVLRQSDHRKPQRQIADAPIPVFNAPPNILV